MTALFASLLPTLAFLDELGTWLSTKSPDGSASVGWVVGRLLVVLAVAHVILILGALMVWAERRVSAWMQDRLGPNRVGPQGLLQPLADLGKFMFKEDVIPAHVNKWMYTLAPALSLVPAMITFAVIPFAGEVQGDGTYASYQIADLNIGVLYILAVASLGVYGISLGGWASNSKYSLLGGVRASAQMISYELSMGLAVIPVVLDGQQPQFERRGRRAVRVRLVPLPAARRGLHLPHRGLRRDEPPALRHAGVRDRARGRVSHRVLVDEVRPVLPRGVHGDDRRGGPDRHALLRRLDLLRSREARLGHGPPDLRGEDAILPRALHLGALDAAALPLRPAHDAGLGLVPAALAGQHRPHGRRARVPAAVDHVDPAGRARRPSRSSLAFLRQKSDDGEVPRLQPMDGVPQLATGARGEGPR